MCKRCVFYVIKQKSTKYVVHAYEKHFHGIKILWLGEKIDDFIHAISSNVQLYSSNPYNVVQLYLRLNDAFFKDLYFLL